MTILILCYVGGADIQIRNNLVPCLGLEIVQICKSIPYMNNITLLDADSSAHSTAVGTWVLAGITFLAVFIQALFNRKTLRDSNKNAADQFELTRGEGT
jgi:hypothetical protein